MQSEVQDENEKVRVQETAKEVILLGDAGLLDLIAVLVYDTKPVYFLSMPRKEIQWTRKKRKVYDKKLKKMVNSYFLRLNINDGYNFGMGNVDITDQTTGLYRFDKWSQNCKWWHSIFW